MVSLTVETEQGRDDAQKISMQIVEDICYLTRDQMYRESIEVEQTARANGCNRIRTVVAVKDVSDVMQHGFTPIEVILGGMYVVEKKLI